MVRAGCICDAHVDEFGCCVYRSATPLADSGGYSCERVPRPGEAILGGLAYESDETGMMAQAGSTCAEPSCLTEVIVHL